ncbi:MAG: diguanylate cyclase [Chloroflexota bacterium]
MRIAGDGLTLLPVVLFAAAGAAAAALGAEVVAAPLLAVGLGAVIGVASTRLARRSGVRALADAATGLADGTLTEVPPAERFGSLAPVARSLAEVALALESAQEAATTDRLTHVANRPTLLADLFAEVERAGRYQRPLSVAFIDLDHFKAINDTFGHEVGDIVLRDVAHVFRANTRQTDLVGRYGGEEFVLVFPETTVDEATEVAEKLRLQVLKLRFPDTADDVAVSVSIGIAGGQGQHLRVDQLLRDADAAMYSAKSLGRNQTFVFAEVDDDSARIPRAPISPAGRARAAEVGEIARQAAEAALAAVVAPLPHYRGKPSSLIAAIAVQMARRLEQPEQEVQRIRVASLLHDVGKVAVPTQILEKPGPLTADEWQSIVQHPRLGQVIIDQVAAVRDAGAIILHHHEHYSGHGYPFGLRGSDIPLGSRIVAIADAYDAMIHDRPYRAAVSHDAAVAELRKHAQIQFDPELVDLFCSMFAASPPRPDPSLLISAPSPLDEPSARRERRRASSA